jgi:hypothetical protein
LYLMGRPEKTIRRAACRHRRRHLDSADHTKNTAGSEPRNLRGVARAKRRQLWKKMMMLSKSLDLPLTQLPQGVENQLQPRLPAPEDAAARALGRIALLVAREALTVAKVFSADLFSRILYLLRHSATATQTTTSATRALCCATETVDSTTKTKQRLKRCASVRCLNNPGTSRTLTTVWTTTSRLAVKQQTTMITRPRAERQLRS